MAGNPLTESWFPANGSADWGAACGIGGVLGLHRLRRRLHLLVAQVQALAVLGVVVGMVTVFRNFSSFFRSEYTPFLGILPLVVGLLVVWVHVQAWLEAPFQPLLWIRVMAVAASLDTILAQHLDAPDTGQRAVWAGLLWFAFLPALRPRSFLRRFPRIAMRYGAGTWGRRQEVGRIWGEDLAGSRAAPTPARRFSASEKAARLSLGWTIGIGMSVMSSIWTRPKPLAPALERFEQAWEAENWSGIADLAGRRVEDFWIKGLREQCAERGWEGHMPQLGPPSVDCDFGGCDVSYTLLDGSSIQTAWITLGKRRHLLDVDLLPPPFASVAEAFTAAWGRCTADDLDALAAFWNPERRQILVQELVSLARKHSWRRLPPVREATILTAGKRTTLGFSLELEISRVEVDFAFDPGSGHWLALDLRLVTVD